MPSAPSGSVRDTLLARLDSEGISQRELARRLGWTQPRVQRRLSGETRISTDELERIAEVLGVPVADLLAGAA